MRNLLVTLLGAFLSLRFDLPKALVEAMHSCPQPLQRPRKVIAPLVQKIEFLFVGHLVPRQEISHENRPLVGW
jgi:hypothetical protein